MVRSSYDSSDPRTLPSVEIVIPTLNCRRLLEWSLPYVAKQDYIGSRRTTIVDGGSRDGTIEFARGSGAKVVVRPGIFSTGLTGARNLALRDTTADLYWQIDSDNAIVEETALTDLVRPLTKEERLSYSYPEIVPDPACSGFSNWLTLEEKSHVSTDIKRGEPQNGYVEVNDVGYGLTNGTLIRTEALRRVGGYDSDVRVLARLRKLHLASAAYVPTAHLIHRQTAGPIDFLRKHTRRLRSYGDLTAAELRAYFVDYPPDHDALIVTPAVDLAGAPLRAARQLLLTGELTWGWGLVFPAIAILAVLMRPRDAIRTMTRFL